MIVSYPAVRSVAGWSRLARSSASHSRDHLSVKVIYFMLNEASRQSFRHNDLFRSVAGNESDGNDLIALDRELDRSHADRHAAFGAAHNLLSALYDFRVYQDEEAVEQLRIDYDHPDMLTNLWCRQRGTAAAYPSSEQIVYYRLDLWCELEAFARQADDRHGDLSEPLIGHLDDSADHGKV